MTSILLALLLFPVDRLHLYQHLTYTPTFGGNFLRNGYTGAPPMGGMPMEIWRVRTGGIVYSSPVIDGQGRLYVGSQDDFLYCISPDGRVLWRFHAGNDIDSTPTIHGRDLYVGSDTRFLYAIHKDTGKLKWQVYIGKSASSPYVDDRIIVATAGDAVFGLSHSRQILWRTRLDSSVVRSSVAYYSSNRTFYVASRAGRVYAISRNGTILWTLKLNESSYDGTVTIGADGRMFVSTTNHVFAISPSGHVLWKQSGTFHTPPAVLSDGSIVAAGRGNVYRFSPEGRQIWRIPLPRGRDDNPYSHLVRDRGDNVFFGTRGDRIYGVSPDGNIIVTIRRGADVDSTPLLLPQGIMIAGSDDKDIIAYQYWSAPRGNGSHH